MISVQVAGKPRDNDDHTWSDFIELLAIINLDRSCTLVGAIDRVMDSPEDEETEDGGDDLDDHLLIESSPRAAERERVRRHFLDAMQLCVWRAAEYGEKYPFLISSDRSVISVKEDLTEAMYSYLFLLLCGSQPFVVRDNHQLTNGFELVSGEILANLMPAGSLVFPFGKATATRYPGTKFEKLKKLSEDVHGQLQLSEADYRDGDRGDAGLDLVAWHDLGDSVGHKPVAFAQCACSRTEWVRKQGEVVSDVLGGHITTKPWWMPYVFIPLCFRSTAGNWAVPGEVKRVVLVDRLRILNNCRDFARANAVCMARPIVDSIFATEGVV